MAMPESYSWIEHGVSESGAQGVPNAWIARCGFVLLGLATLWLATYRRSAWQQPGTAGLMLFGVAMIGVAAQSARSWDDAVEWNSAEDTLHSVFASAVGAGFVIGLASIIVAGALTSVRPIRLADVAVWLVAFLVPFAGGTAMWGALQRTMFACAIAWLAAEALAAAGVRRPG